MTPLVSRATVCRSGGMARATINSDSRAIAPLNR